VTQRLPGYEATLRSLFLVQFLLLLACLGVNVVAARPARVRQAAGSPDAPAWHGLATTLFAGAGWILALLYAVAVMFGATWWLNGGNSGTPEVASTAPTLQWAACALVLGVVVLLCFAVGGWRTLQGLRRQQTEELIEGLRTPGKPVGGHERAAAAVAARWRALHIFDGFHVLSRVGWFALAILAITTVGALIATLDVAAQFTGDPPWAAWAASPSPDGVPAPRGLRWLDTDISWFADIGAWLAVGLLLALVALVGSAYRNAAARRIIGIVWDIATFWPRAAHPFAPPCYAERAVPQLMTRVTGRDREPLLLAGHSQGALLAIACIFQLSPERRRTVFLLTYGTQLTRIYGRVFPAFFGRDSRTTLAAALRDGNDLQKTRWRSLWRPTDPLGWPIAYDHAGRAGTATTDPLAEVVDIEVNDPEGYRPASPGEVLDPPVRQHSDYTESAEYVTNRDEAAATLLAMSSFQTS
jgi:hypothetical protein